MAKIPYTKPAKSYIDQLSHLKQMGLIVKDDKRALKYLEAQFIKLKAIIHAHHIGTRNSDFFCNCFPMPYILLYTIYNFCSFILFISKYFAVSIATSKLRELSMSSMFRDNPTPSGLGFTSYIGESLKPF